MDTATTRLLDLWKASKGIESDHAAWQALRLSGQSAVSNWRHGRSHAAPSLVSRMASEAGADPGYWLALIEADRARSEDDKKAWRTLARRFGAAAAIALCAVAAPLISADSAAYAKPLPSNAYYVKALRILRRILQQKDLALAC